LGREVDLGGSGELWGGGRKEEKSKNYSQRDPSNLEENALGGGKRQGNVGGGEVKTWGRSKTHYATIESKKLNIH